MTFEELEQLKSDAFEVLEVLEDTASHLCNDRKLSGQKVWTMIHSFAQLKVDEFPEPFQLIGKN
tara:strand:- start:142 stop:333 length:192 start_codon:yes stop_codon:yes gene_type:complete